MQRKCFLKLSLQATAMALTYNLISCKKSEDVISGNIHETMFGRLVNNNKIYILGNRKPHQRKQTSNHRIDLKSNIDRPKRYVTPATSNFEIIGYLCLNQQISKRGRELLRAKRISDKISLIYFKESRQLEYAKELRANMYFIRENEINIVKPYHI